jgi:Fic family protein
VLCEEPLNSYQPVAGAVSRSKRIDVPGDLQRPGRTGFTRQHGPPAAQPHPASHSCSPPRSTGQPLSVSVLEDLQAILVAGTPAKSASSGKVRDIQVVIGKRATASVRDLPIRAARFVPSPPGDTLINDLRQLMDWMREDHRDAIDPVMACAMAHYQFETLHPFNDGNGRVGRLLVVLHLRSLGVLEEPTLTISPWFEARRGDYYDRLLAVSTAGDWDGFVEFFAQGLEESAELTHRQMLGLVAAQQRLRSVVRQSSLRAENAQLLVDLAVANPTFTVRRVSEELGVSVGRANKLVTDLTELGVLAARGDDNYNRRFYAPAVFGVLLGAG